MKSLLFFIFILVALGFSIVELLTKESNDWLKDQNQRFDAKCEFFHGHIAYDAAGQKYCINMRDDH